MPNAERGRFAQDAIKKPTFTQANSLVHSFYQNGVFLPTRTIVFGTNPLEESSEKP